jgi:RimJ/RimL family protein N-acetyltransferase
MIFLRPVNKGDIELLFEWANDSEVREMSVNSEGILWKDHLSWFNKKINDAGARIFILTDGEQKFGQIRFDKSAEGWLVDYSIGREFRKKGLGREIIRLGIEEMQSEKLIAFVKPKNISSINVFEKQGFTCEGETMKGQLGLIKYVYIDSARPL